MSWQQRSLEILEFHESKTAEHGVPVASKIKNGWSIYDTAKHFEVSAATISYELRLARILRESPNKFDGLNKYRAIEVMNQGDGNLVEIKSARTYMTGRFLKSIDINGHEFFVVKLVKTLYTNPIDIDYMIFPAYQCKLIREKE